MKKMSISWRIHPAGVIAAAAAFLLTDSHLVLTSVITLFFHEAAHVLVMAACGSKTCTVEITPFGGMADLREYDALNALKQFLISIAGLVANLILFVLSIKFAPDTYFWKAFIRSNASLVLLNVLPCWPLDGARCLVAIASIFNKERQMKRLFIFMTKLLGVVVVIIFLYGIMQGVANLSLLLIGPYLIYAAQSERVAQRVYQFEKTSGKHAEGGVFPVKVWTVGSSTRAEQLSVLLGKANCHEYNLFIQLDHKNGRIQRYISEQEMMNYLLSSEEIDTFKT